MVVVIVVLVVSIYIYCTSLLQTLLNIVVSRLHDPESPQKKRETSIHLTTFFVFLSTR